MRNEEARPLKECVFTNSGGSSISNYDNHLVNIHDIPLLQVKDYKMTMGTEETTSAAPTSGSGTNRLPFKRKANPKPKHDEVLRELHELMYVCCNDLNLPIVTVLKPAWRNLMKAVSKKGHLVTDEELCIGKQKYLIVQAESFAGTLSTIFLMVERTANYYDETTGNHFGFISVSHDLWDGSKRELLGLSISFVDPLDAKFYQVPVGLLEAKSKKAKEVADQSLKLLSRIGITQSHLYRPINDTTNAALAAGRLIVGTNKNGTCDMHQLDLVTEHATGQAVRKRGGVIVDQFVECEGTRKSVFKLVGGSCPRNLRDATMISKSLSKRNLYGILYA